MADDILHALQHLRGLSPDIHWFCPRIGNDDDSYWYDEDIVACGSPLDEQSSARRESKLQEVEERKKVVLEAIKILAYDGPDAAPFKEWVIEHLKVLMRSCDVCVRIYHRLRVQLKTKLEAEHDADDVTSFLSDFDAMNKSRITEGLDTATAELSVLPPEQRVIQALQPTGLYAIFEALSCMPVLLDEKYLVDKFDQPFGLVQTRKPLKLNNLVPAAFQFLFTSCQDRYSWAYYTVGRYKRTIGRTEFEWNIKDALLLAMGRVQLYNLDRDFLPKFWDAAKIIVSKLDRDVITHCLKAMDLDLCRLMLEHMSIDTLGFPDLLLTFQTLLERSPSSVWDSMEAVGAISPVTVLDQIFNNRAFERSFALRDPPEGDHAENGWLLDITGWISPFMASMKTINRVPACRSLLGQLLSRFQDRERFPPRSISFSFSCAISVLDEILSQLLEGNKVDTFAGPAPVAEILDIVRSHIGTIAGRVRGCKLGQSSSDPVVSKCLSVVEQAVALDCLWLTIECRQIKSKRPPATSRGNDSAFWDALVSSIQMGDQALAIRALAGTRLLTKLEDLIVDGKTDPRERTVREAFNNSLGQVLASVRQLLDQIGELSQSDLREVFSDPSSSQTVLTALFFPRFETRIAAVEVIKGFSDQTGRREAFQALANLDLQITLGAFDGAIQNVIHGHGYAPANALLKVSTDLLDVLCDSQEGILQSRSVTPAEGASVEKIWMALWQLLSHIFAMTEPWNDLGHDKNSLVDFCRDTMQFADRLFDDYSVVHTVVRPTEPSTEGPDGSTLPNGTAAVGERLLDAPNSTMAPMAKWLRLRDEYLSIKIVSLVSKLLRRLHDEKVSPADTTVGYIKDVIGGTVKTKLTIQQFAELRRALEDTGFVVDDESSEKEKDRLKKKDGLDAKAKAKKQMSLGGWLTLDTPASKSGSESDSIGKVVSDSTTAAAKFKAMMRKEPERPHTGRLPPGARKPPEVDDDAAAEFRRKRLADLEAKKARDRAAAIKARGSSALRSNDVLSNAGTGLRGLGVLGKEHSRGEGMMVSSDDSDSSSDDSDDLDRELFGLTAKDSRPKEQAVVKAPVIRGPVRKERRARSQRDMRARLVPDLTDLHKTILAWDIFFKSEYPPGSRADLYQAVPGVFTNPTDYRRVFERLLLLEAWQGLVKTRDEQGPTVPFEIRIAGRTSVDSFIEVGTSMDMKDHEIAGVWEGDLVLLSRTETEVNDMTVPHCLARVGRVQRKKGHVEISYRVIGGGNPMSSVLAPNCVVYGVKVQTLTPLEREYGSLVSLQYYDLCDEIIRATPAPILEYSEKELEPISKAYKLNPAQTRAVKSAIDNDSFTLIQGPPGSGKTKTITAIVGAILSTAYTSKYGNRNETLILNPSYTGTGPDLATKKMLVCAPSNAAVDELVLRLKQGITTLAGTQRAIKVVRLGRSDAINAGVQDVTLDELVSRALDEGADKDKGGDGADGKDGKDGKDGENSVFGLMKQHQSTSAELAKVRKELESATADQVPRLRSDFTALKQRQQQLSAQIDQARENQNLQFRQSEMNRRRAQQRILSGADVICATLSGSGHEVFQSSNLEFDTVVVDEAAQCVEMSALIPLKYGAAKVILVGDPKQLPPTVFSREAARFQYEQSLFVRMQKNKPKDVHLLDTQYRMHPDISRFPSQAFYDGRLLDGPDMGSLRTRPWHATGVLSPYRFFNVAGQHQTSGSHSLINIAEAEAAIQLYDAITTMASQRWPDVDLHRQIGIITPYKSQLKELKSRFSRAYGMGILNAVEFNTTDAFQGRESEIIIFSCVRASPSGGVGFLQDIRRMNVGLTRAKSSLWVLGNADSLMRGEYWRRLIEDSQSRGLFSREGVTKLLNDAKSGRGWIGKGNGPKDNPPARITEVKPEKDRPSNDTVKRKRRSDSDDQASAPSSDGITRPPAKTARVSKASPPSSPKSVAASDRSSKGGKLRDQNRGPDRGPDRDNDRTGERSLPPKPKLKPRPNGDAPTKKPPPKAIRIATKARSLPGFAPMRSAGPTTGPPSAGGTIRSGSLASASSGNATATSHSSSSTATPLSGPVSAPATAGLSEQVNIVSGVQNLKVTPRPGTSTSATTSDFGPITPGSAPGGAPTGPRGVPGVPMIPPKRRKPANPLMQPRRR